FRPVRADYHSLLRTEEGMKLLRANPLAIKKHLNGIVFPLLNNVLEDFYDVARDSDIVIYRPKTLAHSFTSQLPGRSVRAAVVPGIASTADFGNPVMGGLQWLPKVFNRFTYSANKFIYNWFNDRLKDFRLKQGWSEPRNGEDSPALYGISKEFLPQPSDWPRNHYMTGFWFAQTSAALPEKHITDFLDSGEPPILVTLGSMSVKTKLPFEKLLESALKETNERFLVAKGWQNWETSMFDNNDRIMFADDLPYGSLLPRVKAVVHHGGIGTIAECLRAGKPMFICPVLHPLGDHMFWGRQVWKTKCGVQPVPLNKLMPQTFVKHLGELSLNKELHENAMSISRRIQEENGVATAADLLENIGPN
ncbi:MAG TPA: glycosyltransferase, partial [Anseongella sp.]|nr:glycosyltransferase [Anseongella sp.]